MKDRRVQGMAGLQQAFDEVRFGAQRTLNLRTGLPTGHEAAQRLEKWLREHQVYKSGEVLVVTGRGNNSEGGRAVVRETSIRVFHELHRKNVIQGFTEHTPGSFVVQLAAMSALGATHRDAPAAPPPVTPPTLGSLHADTLRSLRVLAERSLDALGVRERPAVVLEDEMLQLFGKLGASLGDGPNREERLRAAIDAAMDNYD